MFITQKITRFNLVCHGLMWFWREGDKHLRILIPDEKVHVYKIGSVDKKPGGTPHSKTLEDLSVGTGFRLTGVAAGNLTIAAMAADFGLPVLHQNQLTRNGTARTEILLPLPDQIRSYCHAETRNVPMIAAHQYGAVNRMPSGVAIVVVLSWFLTDETPIQISDLTYSYTPLIIGDVANLSIYAQEENPNADDPRHGDVFNDLIHFRGSPLTLNATSLDLKPDAPPSSTQIGVSEPELQPLTAWYGATTDRTGCVSGAAL